MLGVSVSVPEFVIPLIDVGLEFNGESSFFLFDEQERQHLQQKLIGAAAGNHPAMQRSMPWVRPGLSVDVAGESSGHENERSWVSHGDADDDLHDLAVSVLSLASADSDVTLTVKKSSGVMNFGHVRASQVIDGMMANSVDIQCPARKGAEGQYRAKQRESAGVCNEHVPSPEGKICSELGGNVEKSAEMTGSACMHSVSVSKSVTDCNSRYLELVAHRDADLEVMDEIRPVNQDGAVVTILWMGNLTCSNRSRQGVQVA